MKIPLPLPALGFAAILSVGVFLSASRVGSQPEDEAHNPVATGTIKWERDYQKALAAAKKSGKPIFALFQEVPGCAGCQQFGREVLSDKQVVAAIEQNFTPLLIHNNKAGADQQVLEQLGEPAWNYQVVRFLDAAGHDLIPRKDHVWKAPELMVRMNAALAKAGKPAMAQRLAFAQVCFWEGEKKLGGINGVLRTEVGFLDGNEVTLVDFDPKIISADQLTRQAQAAGVATKTYHSLAGYQKAPDSDQKRQLQGTKYAKLKLTPEEATKANAHARSDP